MAEIDARLESEMSPERKLRLGRIQFRAWRRGFREADMVLGPFADQVAPGLDDGELDQFEALLNEEDVDSLAWAMSQQPVPERYAGPMMDALQRLDFVEIPR